MIGSRASLHECIEKKQLDYIIYLKLFCKAIEHINYEFTGVRNARFLSKHAGRTREKLKSYSRVFPTSQVVYNAGKLIVNVFYSLSN